MRLDAQHNRERLLVLLLARMQRAAENLIERARRAKIVRASISGDDLCRLLLGVHAAAFAGDQLELAARRYADIVLRGLSVPTRESDR